MYGLSIGYLLVGDDKYGYEIEYKGLKLRCLCLYVMCLDILGYVLIEVFLFEDM